MKKKNQRITVDYIRNCKNHRQNSSSRNELENKQMTKNSSLKLLLRSSNSMYFEKQPHYNEFNKKSQENLHKYHAHSATQSLRETLKEKDRELQNIIEKIVQQEKTYKQQLQMIDQQYQQQINELHEILQVSILRNKELQQKINFMDALGLENSLEYNNSSEMTVTLSGESLLLKDCQY